MGRYSSNSRAKGWHWSDYWRAGGGAALVVENGSGPAFDTTSLWRDYFSTFGSGAVLLDMAAGSGDVARKALQVADDLGLRFDIHAVDYADPEILAQVPSPGFRLTGGVSLEALPFEAGSFDGAASQFGIEYAQPKPALAELARVLKPGGRVAMLVHHAESVLTTQAAAQVLAYDKVLGSGSVLKAARRAFDARAKGARAAVDAADAAFTAALARAAGRLTSSAAYAPSRYLVSYLDDLRRRADAYVAESALLRLDEFENGNAAWRRRQVAQVEAALDDGALEGFLQRARASGLEPTLAEPARDSGNQLLAWRLELVREA